MSHTLVEVYHLIHGVSVKIVIVKVLLVVWWNEKINENKRSRVAPQPGQILEKIVISENVDIQNFVVITGCKIRVFLATKRRY
jgi:hypothetical protein